MPTPLFTGGNHICIATRDIDRAVRVWWDRYGVGPWPVFSYDAANATVDAQPGFSMAEPEYVYPSACSHLMSEPPLRVLIAGGGVAGLEALHGLHALAGERVELTLIAPEDEFVYRPLAVEKPFGVGRARQVPLTQAARQAGADFVAGTLGSVDAEDKVARTSDGNAVGYDALLLAVGATAVPVVPNALTWDDRADSETLGGLIQDIDQGYSHSLAVVIPPGPGWPLRGCELALFIAIEAHSMSSDHRTTLVAPEPAPLDVLGSRGVDLVLKELEKAEVAVVSAASIDVERGQTTTLVLHPSGQRVEVGRMLALPALRGRPIRGIPTDDDGFIEVDEHCRVRGLDGVWAAGDATAFPLKSGGFAAEEADVAAEDIAATAGAAVEARAFDPGSREDLAGLPAGRYLNAWLAVSDDEGLTTHVSSTDVPVLTYLARDFSAGQRGKT
jgi:sulfide:quinone oxidoreductase